MNYLVTGGAGFIGSHLVDRLLKEDCNVTLVESDSANTAKVRDDGKGNKIIVIDDFSEGKWANLPVDPRLTVYKASIMDDIGHLFEGIDVVFHLAGLTRPQWSILYPEESNLINVDGTIKVFMHAKDHKVKRVVFVSSSSAYGEQPSYPSKEDDVPNPMCPYALQKYVGEQYASLFGKLYGLQVNSIRPFNVYGSRMNPRGVYSGAVPKFIDQINKGEGITITGDGNQERDFIYVDDTVEIIYRASYCPEHGEVFNAGSGTNISINNLLKIICKIMGKDVLPTYIPKVYEPSMTLSDMSKVERIFNWKPQIGLEEGLRRTVEATLNEKKNRC